MVAGATVTLAIGVKSLDAIMSTKTLLDRTSFGAYAANEPWPNVQPHYDLEGALGVVLPTMSWFQSWHHDWLGPQVAQAASTNHDLLIALQPASDSGTPVPFDDILAGAWDKRLTAYFSAAAAYPGTVTIRMMHEMNLGQHVWSIVNANPCTADLDVWLDTWRYIVDLQRGVQGQRGGQVNWQWCVSSIDMGTVRAEAYWPGADYVDSLSLDVYNGFGGYWTAAAKLIQPMYDRLIALHPSAPVWIAEVGCRPVLPSEKYSKAQWFSDLFAMTTVPRITNVCFFDANKEYDWRVTTVDVAPVISKALKAAQSRTR
jgi:hypothetical protein